MYASPTQKFKEDVLVVYAFQKDMKKFFFERIFFALSINTKNRKKVFASRINESSK